MLAQISSLRCIGSEHCYHRFHPEKKNGPIMPDELKAAQTVNFCESKDLSMQKSVFLYPRNCSPEHLNRNVLRQKTRYCPLCQVDLSSSGEGKSTTNVRGF